MESRTPKGRPSIKSSNGWLQLVFTYQGQRRYFSLALKDNEDNRRIAQDKATWIHNDILTERFDESLERYKSKAQLTLVSRENPDASLSVRDLWDRYLAYKAPQLSPTTLQNQMAAVTSHLERLPQHTLGDAISIRDWLLINLTIDSARRTLMQLSACCRWATKSQLITNNPFYGMPQDIKVRKPHPEDIDPFTKDEVAAITAEFDATPYGPFVRFLFLTGVRSGEARGVQWRHIRRHWLLIEQSRSTRDDITDTKTHRPRRFPVNRQLADLLASVKTKECGPNDYVFSIGSVRTFQDNWTRIVSRLVDEGKVERYRPQYNTRHTFITNCLEAGVSVPQIAKWAGNSPEVILRHYAGVGSSVQVPEFGGSDGN